MDQEQQRQRGPRTTRAVASFLSMARSPNEVLLQQLRDGTAEFEFLPPTWAGPSSVSFFARIGPSSTGASPAMKKVQHYSIQKVTGDGRCLFRALVKGMARNKGTSLGPGQEKDDADELRMAVKEIICGSDKERLDYEEALIAITVEESLKRYCKRIEHSDFWGGESELLVLSKLCRQPIIVYIPQNEHNGGGRSTGFIPIAEYGSEFGKKSKKGKPKVPVRLLYSGSNHYDLLV